MQMSVMRTRSDDSTLEFALREPERPNKISLDWYKIAVRCGSARAAAVHPL